MQVFDIRDELTMQRSLSRGADDAYRQFLSQVSMRLGIYVLPTGGEDLQQPHTEDEAYYVLAGRGKFSAGEDDRDVSIGNLIFVEAGVQHRFHSIEEELRLLVMFAPGVSDAEPAVSTTPTGRRGRR